MTRIVATSGMALVGGLVCAQVPAPAPGFEVASIRPARPPLRSPRRWLPAVGVLMMVALSAAYLPGGKGGEPRPDDRAAPGLRN